MVILIFKEAQFKAELAAKDVKEVIYEIQDKFVSLID
jgi:hypothetical protein